jgi:murein DD-endopeptidase MepM/ murein hydrolase activator NlpD
MFDDLCLRRLLTLFVIASFLMACNLTEPTPERTEEAIVVVEPTAMQIPTITPIPPTATETVIPVSPTQTPKPTRTPTLTPLPTFVPAWYTVEEGDTLLAIAINYETSTEDLLELNRIEEDEGLNVGDVLAVPSTITVNMPECNLVPDSEVVNGTAYVDWDTQAFLEQQGGYLANYVKRGRTAGEIIDGAAYTFHVGPRVLVAAIEMLSGWVTNAQPSVPTPFNLPGAGNADLAWHSGWAAKKLMQGYYGQLEGRRDWAVLSTGQQVRLYPGTTPGSAGVANLLAAVQRSPEELEAIFLEGRFEKTYRRLFGDIVDEGGLVMPPNGEQPYFALPWRGNEQWVFTGGPHGGYGDYYSGWAALDFAPPVPTGCWPSVFPVRSVAPGIVLRSDDGQVWVDLDQDGDIRTGWVVLYMHMAEEGRVDVDTRLETGDPVGFPSCEGGVATASHLHIARMYNGQWMPANNPVPFQLGNWTAQAKIGESYGGRLVSITGSVMESCDCRSRYQNIFAINLYDDGYPTSGR